MPVRFGPTIPIYPWITSWQVSCRLFVYIFCLRFICLRFICLQISGTFESACRLLHDQVGVVNFEPYKEKFMANYARSGTSFAGLPYLPSLTGYPQSNWKEAGPKQGLPAVGKIIHALSD